MMEIKDVREAASSVPGLAEISRNYMEDFISEIKETLEGIELELVDLEMEPGNAEHLNSIYCSFHTIRGLAGLLHDAVCGKIAATTEELLETMRKYGTPAGKSSINLILVSVRFIRKICEGSEETKSTQFLGEVEQHIRNIQKLKDDIILEVRQPPVKGARIGEILVAEGALKHDEVEDVLRKQNSVFKRMKFGEIVLREKKVDVSDIIKAIRMQKIRNAGSSDQYVKIPLERLDQIIGIIGNIGNIFDSVRDEAVLRFGSNDALTMDVSKAFNMVQDVKSILKELRMVTLQQTFQKLTRAACTIIEENHLEVMFSTMGENIEVDKEIADKIVYPLGELIKLLLEKAYTETDAARRIGSVEVVAYEEGNSVHIDITGDQVIDIEVFKSDARWTEVASRLSDLQCRLSIDDMEGGGVRISIIIQR
ncbi:MAG TPA: hypothetical protein PKZ62_01265 [Thermoclostridium caenicola]|uniref:hypothetical protein n=1 Tax=Thermoclostridium caenicola TaxID=659425 RepID=UPI002BF7A528|nr:hypothetical protein [Thermoclostridium caenicola]HOL83910.1 hypothetical protein [Thermoclostridium caenicola]HPO76334.1 hypothetical protein [Thermoclostridium caenicola]HPU21961.1 hypothetical protein [Thermoclostridium caenicola]